MIYKEFYSELGKLLYAISDIDHFIPKEEAQKLLEIVKKELVPNEVHTDRFGTDAAYYTEIEYEFLDETIGDAQMAFDSFISFVEDHHSAFDEKLKNTCLEVSKKLAGAYRGTNKKEKQLIEKLKETLNKI